MKSCLCCAYFTLLMVSIISSCLLFLLVASESTKVRQNLEKNDNFVNTNHENDKVYDYNENSDNNIIQNNDKIESDSSDNSDLNKNNVVFFETISKNSGITENELQEIPAPVHITLVDNPQQIIDNAIEENLENVLKPQSQNFSIRKLNEIPPIPEVASAEKGKLILDNRIVVQEEIVVEEDLFNDSGGNEANDSNLLNTNGVDAPITADDVTNGTEEHPIPVFSEWAQKHMEEAEKLEKQESVSNLSSIKKNATVKQPNVKLRAKNYASPDCGAKIIASNPEAQSTSSVLSTSKDEYMLNPCQSRIWFVVELCEPIRAEKIELANFELFSSSPKQFSIGVTNRYPTRDWSIVGQFTAQDERDIQKFKLHPHLFGKFIKVEIHSHYSSEHFCPISLFSVYGTSEFEAFATENEPLAHNQDEEFINDEEDDDDDKIFMADNNLNNKHKDNPNILKSAGEAVMSIVKKAAEVLTPKSNENNPSALNNYTQLKENNYIGYTPNYEITCRDCSTKLIIQIRNIVEFNYYGLLKMLDSKTIYNALTKTNVCSNFINSSTTLNYKSYVTGILSIQYVSALCNILFNGNLTELNRNIIIDKRNENSEHNTSEIVYNNLTLNDKIEIDVDSKDKQRMPDIPPDTLCPSAEILNGMNINDPTIDFGKLLDNSHETTIETPPTTESTMDTGEPSSTIQIPNNGRGTEDTKNTESIEDSVTKPNDHIQEPNELPIQLQTEELPIIIDASEISGNSIHDTQTPTSSPITTQSDSGNGELNVDTVASSNGNQAVAPSANQKAQSESVFLRLSTRIKALERNLSLSEQYLEELSRRYKKQVEELQQSFSKVLLTIEDQNRRYTERETLLMDQNARLREEMNEIHEKINSRTNFYIIGFIIFEILLIFLIRTCGRNRRIETHIENNPNEVELEEISNSRRSFLKLFKRRKSLENLCKNQNQQQQITRRLSEEALQTYGEYNDLLILNGTEDDDCVQIIDSRDEVNLDKVEKKKNKSRNRKNTSQKSRANSAEPSGKHPKIKLFRHESAPGKPITVNGDGVRNDYINNIDINDSVLLEENDEFYMPNMDLALNEFMPDGPSFRQQNNSNNNTSSGASSTSIQTTNTNDSTNIIIKPIKFRRLSSPGFLKTALGRNSTKKSSSLSPSSNHEQTTGWEWYKLTKKSNNSSSSTTSSTEPKNHKKSKTDLRLKTSNSGNSNSNNNDFNSNTAPSVVANDSANTSNTKLPNNKTKSGNFKKLFKKVF